MSEASEQAALIEWCNAMAKTTMPELALIFHIPNGGSRNAIEAANLKRQGVKSGVPDLCLPVPRGGYHGLFIEMKDGRNQPTDNQKQWISDLRRQGYAAGVCRGSDKAIETILNYMGVERT